MSHYSVLPFFQKYVLIDTETAFWAEVREDGLMDKTRETRDRAKTRLIQYAVNGQNPVIVDLFREPVPQELLDLAADPECAFVAQNAAYDENFLRQEGVVPQKWICTQVLSQILNTGLYDAQHNLESIVEREIGERPYDTIGEAGLQERVEAIRVALEELNLLLEPWRKSRQAAMTESYDAALAAYNSGTQDLDEIIGTAEEQAQDAAVAAARAHDRDYPLPTHPGVPEGVSDEESLQAWADRERRGNKVRLQLSNWGAETLTQDQLDYAAMDVSTYFDRTFKSLWEKAMSPEFRTVVLMELTILPIVWQMSRDGIKFNLDKWRKRIKTSAERLVEVEREIGEYCDWKLQELFPQDFIIKLRRNKPKEGKPARISKVDGRVLRAEVPGETQGALAAIQPKPVWSPIFPDRLHPNVLALEDPANDTYVGYRIREELGLSHEDPMNITSAQQMRSLVDAVLFEHGVDFTVPDNAATMRRNKIAKIAESNLMMHGVTFTWENTGFKEEVVTEILLPLAQKYDQDLAKMLTLHQEAQGLRKETTTYGASYWSHANEGGYIHATFKTCESDTHRIQSVDPSLMNLPRDFQADLWCCEEDEVLIKADFQGQEGVLLHFLGGQKDIYERILQGLDLHSMSASIMSGTPYDDLVTKAPGKKDKIKPEHSDLRTSAKPMTFAPCYGCGEGKAAKLLKLPREGGRKYLESYWKTYDKVKLMQDAQERHALDLGFVTNLSTGRRRWFRPTKSELQKLALFQITMDDIERGWRNKALNFACQSTGAAILREVLLGVHAFMNTPLGKRIKYTLRLTIHDAIVATCLKEYADIGAKVTQRIMEEAAARAVPGIFIGVDVEIAEKHAPRVFEKPADDEMPVIPASEPTEDPEDAVVVD